MGFFRKPTIANGVLCLLIALGLFSCSGLEYREAAERYAAAVSAPVADYVVAGRHENKVGSGKSRHTEYMLELQQFEAQPLAPRSTELRVADDAYENSNNGDHWRARVVAGQPLFDPDLSGVERENKGYRLLMAVLFAIGGVAVIIAARRQT